MNKAFKRSYKFVLPKRIIAARKIKLARARLEGAIRKALNKN